MKKNILIFLFAALFGQIVTEEENQVDIDLEWLNHKARYGLKFDYLENIERSQIFADNYKKVLKHNSENHGFLLEMNKFGHMVNMILLQKPEEILNCFSTNQKNPQKTPLFDKSEMPVRKSIDWRLYQVVSSVKNQQRCGSCYAFSAVFLTFIKIGAVESHFAIQTGILMNLSEQEIVDCSFQFGNKGCDGGLPDNVFRYMMARGVAPQSNYNYTGKDNHAHRLLSYLDLPQGDEAHLVRTVSFVGPVSIAIDANHVEFMLYKSGVFKIKNCSQENLNHAVLAVGYSVEGESYLIVKNRYLILLMKAGELTGEMMGM
ncbi:Cathepsin L1 [Thelohanellus kitauei]|uniref:Cathepsin L1 n=1 Tax=Thelohanellus kitauei TaxID=669202 RepID=A0A0C2ME96_THEKT|nr:Cathepsin L1 [Thelohanellus kitauei]